MLNPDIKLPQDFRRVREWWHSGSLRIDPRILVADVSRRRGLLAKVVMYETSIFAWRPPSAKTLLHQRCVFSPTRSQHHTKTIPSFQIRENYGDILGDPTKLHPLQSATPIPAHAHTQPHPPVSSATSILTHGRTSEVGREKRQREEREGFERKNKGKRERKLNRKAHMAAIKLVIKA
ncbi:uncharacterized protein [Malus domestica]|uniref:uncharacterized protein n=1 Tax=Malus domestica TaxID=3750 RepID=UPI003975F1BE